MSSRSDNGFEKTLQKTMAAGAARIDQGTRNELARRRRMALDAAERSPSRLGLWIPVGTVAAAVMATLLVQPYFRNQMPDPTLVDRGDIDMEILLAEESLELYEDLEFFEWLDVVGDAG